METQKYYSEYPLVSVLIPTYNGERYISEALLSVLQQTYPNIEIVVSDDASKDYTIDVVQTFQDKEDIPHPIKLITNQTNQGIAKNMNRGLEECNGKYIAILDQDDYWIDNSKLTQQIEFLEENPEYGIVGTQRDILRANQRTSSLLPTTDQQIRAFIPKFCPFQHSAVCYHKALGQEVQGYNARYHCTMDTDFFYKLLQKSQWYNLDTLSTIYRIHGKNTIFTEKNKARREGISIRWKYRDTFPVGYPYLISQIFSLFIPPLIENTKYMQTIQNRWKNRILIP